MMRMLVIVLMVAVATAVGVTSAQAQPTAAGALLTLRDMPAGWSVDPTVADDGPDRGRARLCGEATAPSVATTALDYGRVGFERGRQGPFISNVVGVMPPGEAENALAGWRAFVRPGCAWEETFGEVTMRMRLVEISFPALGDDSVALRVEGEGELLALAVEYVVIRRGDVVSVMSHLAFGFATATVETALTERLARVSADRIGALATE